MKPWTKAVYVSLMSRRDSAAMVSNTSELFPEPDTPVKTVSRRFGMSMLMSRRLFSRAPRTSIAPQSALPLPFVMQSASSTSAHGFLHERGDPCLVSGGQLGQREGGRPHVAVVEVRGLLEAKGRIARLELIRGREEADDLAVFVRVRGHPVPGPRGELRRTGLDQLVDPLGHGPIRCRHLGDLREHVALTIRLVRALAPTSCRLPLLDCLLQGGQLLLAECAGRCRGRTGALGRLLRVVHQTFLLRYRLHPTTPARSSERC